jgi:hypothetical protein
MSRAFTGPLDLLMVGGERAPARSPLGFRRAAFVAVASRTPTQLSDHDLSAL